MSLPGVVSADRDQVIEFKRHVVELKRGGRNDR
jgi:hypothetical protein